ncbi:MAG: asparagine synthase-related protein [Coleofasciculaceae cyanobacterium]
MANFFIIVDPNAERRTHFIKNIESHLPPVAGLTINSCATGDFQAIWAIHPQAPISCIVEQEEAAVIWGDAIIPGEATRLDANALKTLWQKSPKQGLPPYDGFYAAVAYHPHFGLTVTADILGIFPIYYYVKDEVALVASSPELFRHHPLFTPQFNPAGLVGILLTNGLVNGQTLWKGIKRLDAGHCLIAPPQASPQEIKQYETPGFSQHEPYKNLDYSEHLELLEQIIDQTLKRHTLEQQKHTLLLSGGLDSRMLAGFLHRQGKSFVTLTLGKSSDIEMQCAIPVARTLGLEYHTAINQLDHYPLSAELLTQWEHLSSGFNGVAMGWSTISPLNQLAPKVMAGFSIDTAMGKSMVTHPQEKRSFELCWNREINNWGISAEVLNKLLRKEVFGNLVQDTISEVRQTYSSYSDLEFRRRWWYALYQRQRFHVGAYAWRFSFGAWPVLPVLDLELLKTTLSLPLSTVNERRAQNELMCTQFPQLAQLPLDRNAFNVEPLLPNKSRQKLQRLLRLQQKWRRWQQKVGIERRYYYQIFDINNKGWRAVRQQAELCRPLVQQLFHEDVLNELVPPPEVKITCQTDAIIEASGIKALLGFLLWSKNHL